MSEDDHPGSATLQRGSGDDATRGSGDDATRGSGDDATCGSGDDATRGSGDDATLERGAPGEGAPGEGAPGEGAPGGGVPGWHSRGYLPHFENAEAIQHVTYHLADSLPKDVVMRLDEELKRLPVKKQDVERRKRVDAWIDAGHGSCVLREPVIAQMVQNSFLFSDAERYRLLAWVVMPNHVHVLFQPLNGWIVAKIVASWKSFTGRKISAWMKAGNAVLQHGDSANKAAMLGRGVPMRGALRIWHREYWDRYMRDERHLQQTIKYIHQNPLKGRLVTKAEDWRWSSAYTGGDWLQMNNIARLEPGAPETMLPGWSRALPEESLE